jgi:O-antigen ligase
MIALLSAAAALIPLLVIPRWFLYFDAAPKVCVLLLTAGLLLLLWPRLGGSFTALWRQRLGSCYLILAALQIASLLLSSSFSIDPALSFFGTGWRRLGAVQDSAILIVCASAAALIAEIPSRVYVMLRWLCGSGMLIAAYAILQYLGWDPLGDPGDYRAMIGPWLVVRPPGTLGHATHLGSFLVVVLAAAIALIYSGQSKLWTRFAWLCAGLSSLALLASGTRAAWIGAVIMLVVWAIHNRALRTMRRIGVASALVAVSLLLVASPLGKSFRDRTSEWLWLDTSGGPRLLLWQDSLQMAGRHLLLGYGPEVFGGEFPRFQSSELASAYPDSYFESAHNTCLDTLIAQGVPGLLLQLAALLLGLAAAARSRFPRPVATAIAGGCAGIFAAQQFGSAVPATQLMAQLTIAILVAGSTGFREQLRITFAPERLRFLCIPAAAVFLVTAGQILLVDTRWASVQRALADRDPARAMGQSAVAERFYPPDSGAGLWYSRALLDATGKSADPALRDRAWEDGIRAAGNAGAVWDNRANALYNLAAIYWTAGDMERAQAAAQETLACSPQWYKPHWLMAGIHLAQSRPEDAKAEMELARRLAGARAGDLQLPEPKQQNGR